MADEERRAGEGDQPKDADRKHMRRISRQRQARVVKAVVVLTIVVLLIIFVIRNSEPAVVDFIFFTGNYRLIYVLIVMALLGGIAGYILGRPDRKTRLHEEDERGAG